MNLKSSYIYFHYIILYPVYIFSIFVLFNMYIHFSLIIIIQPNDRRGCINYVHYLSILVKRRIHKIIVSIEHIE